MIESKNFRFDSSNINYEDLFDGWTHHAFSYVVHTQQNLVIILLHYKAQKKYTALLLA